MKNSIHEPFPDDLKLALIDHILKMTPQQNVDPWQIFVQQSEEECHKEEDCKVSVEVEASVETTPEQDPTVTPHGQITTFNNVKYVQDIIN